MNLINELYMLRDDILKDNNYMDWISLYLNKNKYLSDYPGNKGFIVSKEIKDQTKKLSVLYLMFKNYANENNININYDGTSEEIFFNYNNEGYRLGYVNDNDGLVYCDKESLENNHEFINFEDLRNSYLSQDVKFNGIIK